MSKPLCIDIFAGLGGWGEGFLAAGYDVVGFDNHRHVYGEQRYPGQLVIQDALTIHGSQCRNATVIVASPPCQKYSYMAMPWSRAKREAKWQRWERDSPFGDFRLNDLFDACFRIQREACEAAGHYIPMIVENVKGAQPWVGRAPWNFGSFYLWGDVPALMPFAKRSPKKIMDDIKNGQRREVPGIYLEWLKVPGMNFDDYEKTGKPGRSFQSAAVEGMKVPSESGRRTDPGKGARFTSRDCGVENGDGVKMALSGRAWFTDGLGKVSSASSARKMASAQIAKIPFPLAEWIARVYHPGNAARTA